MPSEFIVILFVAFVMETIDSSVGMGYGTILSPLLIIMGYSPVYVIPSILFSQTVGGFLAGIFHNKHKNVQFKFAKLSWQENIKRGFTKDLRIVLMVSLLSMLITVFAVYIVFHIPGYILKTYIGILVVIIGLLVLFLKKRQIFSWNKIFFLSVLATFNKGFTGGGFGPVLTGGQILAGQEEKPAIGCTTFSEGPVCLVGFVAYLVLNGINPTQSSLFLPMLIGAAIGGPVGPFVIKRRSRASLQYVIGILMLVLGTWTLAKVWL